MWEIQSRKTLLAGGEKESENILGTERELREGRVRVFSIIVMLEEGGVF